MELDGRDWLGQARRGVIELCVLALIRSEPRYGYQLVTALAQLGRQLAASEGTLYPLLRRLQREGLIDATWQESPDGPPRKYYRLSESGARLLEAELAEWDQLTYAIAQLRNPKEASDGPGSERQPSLSGRAATPTGTSTGS